MVWKTSTCARDVCSDIQRFGKIAKLAAFKPFSSAADALEQINAISEAQLTDELKNFLAMNLPKVCVWGGVPATAAGHHHSPQWHHRWVGCSCSLAATHS